MTRNVLEYLEASACRVPDRAAYVDERGTLSYQSLLTAAKRIGSALSESVPPRVPVAVLMDARDARCVAAFMGVLYAGCCYAPLDASMPPERLQIILGRLCPARILYDTKSAGAVAGIRAPCPALRYDDAVTCEANESRLADIRAQASVYDLLSILYTSGSTGIPKGVTQSQYSYITYTEVTNEKYRFTEDTVFGNQSPFFYANSIIDIFPPFALGATTYILPAKALSFPKYMVEQLNAARVTELTMTPSSYVQVANAGVLSPGILPYLEYIILSGEAASWQTLRQWMQAAPKADVWNFYGSTELFSVAVCRVDRTYADDEIIPVGQLYEHVHILFVDEEGREVARGEKGEMLIANPWLSSGYYRDEQRTAQAYVIDPLQRGYYERFFRTGDLGRINEWGELVVLGRRDSQIKHHGYRMEIGEVEYALRSLPGVQDGCCLFDKEQGTLYCFWSGTPTQREIVAGLKEKLPKFAMPDTYVYLEKMPHTATMKIDRQKLRKYFSS